MENSIQGNSFTGLDYWSAKEGEYQKLQSYISDKDAIDAKYKCYAITEFTVEQYVSLNSTVKYPLNVGLLLMV